MRLLIKSATSGRINEDLADDKALICGSGLVDLLGELLRTDRMNERGRLTGDKKHFVVDGEADILFTEFDINAFGSC